MRPQWAVAARVAFQTALKVRVRPACWAAARANMLSLRALEMFAMAIGFSPIDFIVIDFSSVPSYNVASRPRHPKGAGSIQRVGCSGKKVGGKGDTWTSN